MARYLVVLVYDNARAEKIMTKLDGLIGVEVLGLYHKPSRFCECPPDPSLKSYERADSARGQKLGMWVHPDCGRPRKNNQQMPRNLLNSRRGIVDNHPTLLVWEPSDGRLA